MDAVIKAVTSLVGGGVNWAGQYLALITGEGGGLLLFFAVMSAVGLGVGLIRRMMRL